MWNIKDDFKCCWSNKICNYLFYDMYMMFFFYRSVNIMVIFVLIVNVVRNVFVFFDNSDSKCFVIKFCIVLVMDKLGMSGIMDLIIILLICVFIFEVIKRVDKSLIINEVVNLVKKWIGIRWWKYIMVKNLRFFENIVGIKFVYKFWNMIKKYLLEMDVVVSWIYSGKVMFVVLIFCSILYVFFKEMFFWLIVFEMLFIMVIFFKFVVCLEIWINFVFVGFFVLSENIIFVGVI